MAPGCEPPGFCYCRTVSDRVLDAAARPERGRGEDHRRARAGLVYGISAYTLWGVFPLYFHALASVPPFTVLCHRVVWSALFLAIVVSFRKEWNALFPVLRDRRKLLLLTAGSVLIALNWLIFIYAVGSRQVLQASLGYFINPLLSIALGMLFLGEKLRKWQWVAVGIVILAILNLALRGKGLPWIAISLAATFGFYGLVRKKLDINSLHALLVETAVLFPVSLGLLAVLPTGQTNAVTWTLLLLLGIVTAVPLILFGEAVRRLSLSTFGFLQYVGPTLQFAMATLVFKEPLDAARLVSFVLCWIAIGVYLVDSIRRQVPQEVADEPD